MCCMAQLEAMDSSYALEQQKIAEDIKKFQKESLESLNQQEFEEVKQKVVAHEQFLLQYDQQLKQLENTLEQITQKAQINQNLIATIVKNTPINTIKKTQINRINVARQSNPSLLISADIENKIENEPDFVVREKERVMQLLQNRQSEQLTELDKLGTYLKKIGIESSDDDD